MSSLHFFGIRHHGPGSARSLRTALAALKPDAILVEGPPDANSSLPLAAHPAMEPPVALLVYVPTEPLRAAYYPYAVFSPEWQAIRYGLEAGVAVRCMDLPQAHQLAWPQEAPGEAEAVNGMAFRAQHSRRFLGAQPAPRNDIQHCAMSFRAQRSASVNDTQRGDAPPDLQADPLGWLAEAAGYSDGERWWEHVVEQRRDGEGLFEAILEAMTAVRQAAGYEPATHFEACREAHMRQTIRAAQREGFERIAVVCGAWHAPALAEMPPARKDAALLKGLPRVKVAATWIPWTYGRLAYASGYGAGILSPGWYTHLWECEGEVAIRWLARVAALLREQDLDAAPASVIEAVRLAEALAALRRRPLPGLPELMEATQAVLCFGSDMPLRLIARRLIVGERLGQVPPETPMVPLQQDLSREQKRLRLVPSPEPRDLELDLRQPTGLDRSRLLHRLNLLGVRWGQVRAVTGARGTFREAWRLEWHPEFAVVVIEANRYGSTLEAAAAACAREAADAAGDLPALTHLLDQCLLADLPEAVQHALDRIQAEAALSSDVGRLLEALPPLAHIQRYGSVRQTDAALAAQVAAGLLTRACIGLPGACASLNDEAAAEMYDRLVGADEAVRLLPAPEQQAAWTATLARLAEQAGVHGLVAGRCCRLLHEQGALPEGGLARHTHRALSKAVEPAQAAAWVEGLLKGGAMLLLHDDALWAAVDAWLTEVPPAAFTEVAPLLRRTFATFSPPERRQMGERARRGLRPAARAASDGELDTARAEAVLPLIRQLLGLAEGAQGRPPVSGETR